MTTPAPKTGGFFNNPWTKGLGIGGLGGLAGLFGGMGIGNEGGALSWLTGRPGGFEHFKNFSPEQEDIINKILGRLGGLNEESMDYLHQILSDNPELMKQFEAPALRQFQEQIVPGLAERFTQAGARSSSGFNQALAQQAGSLSERLAAMRAGLKNQALQGVFNFGKFGLSPLQTNFYRPGEQGLLGSLASGFGSALGMGAFL